MVPKFQGKHCYKGNTTSANQSWNCTTQVHQSCGAIRPHAGKQSWSHLMMSPDFGIVNAKVWDFSGWKNLWNLWNPVKPLSLNHINRSTFLNLKRFKNHLKTWSFEMRPLRPPPAKVNVQSLLFQEECSQVHRGWIGALHGTMEQAAGIIDVKLRMFQQCPQNSGIRWHKVAVTRFKVCHSSQSHETRFFSLMCCHRKWSIIPTSGGVTNMPAGGKPHEQFDMFQIHRSRVI